MQQQVSVIGLILLVGAILALLGVFLDWVTFSGSGVSVSATGWDLTSGKLMGVDFMRNLVPLVVIILAVIVIVFAIMDFLGKGNQVMFAVLVIGIVVILLSFAAYDSFKSIFDMVGGIVPGGIGVDISMGIGIYVEFVAGAILIIASLLVLAGVIKEDDPVVSPAETAVIPEETNSNI